MACGARRTNLYPAGCNPFQGPSCALRGRGAPRGMGPFSTAAFFSHVETRSHIRLGFHKLLLSVHSLPLEDGASWHQASFKIAP
jgi:hypothetical protein